MANGQPLSGDEEESNTTAEATDYTDNEDLPSVRQFHGDIDDEDLSEAEDSKEMEIEDMDN